MVYEVVPFKIAIMQNQQNQRNLKPGANLAY
jgi:hypothetical protein